MATTAEAAALARAVLADGPTFDRQLAAVIRNAGLEARELHHLTDDERDDVIVVLGRISAGSHYPHLRTDGSFEIRRAVGQSAASQQARKPRPNHVSRSRRMGRA